MTIFDARWRSTFHQDVMPRLAAAHPDLTRIAAILRDTGAQVWTETPTDDSLVTSPAYSLEGWRIHFGGERQRLAAFEAAHGAALQGFDTQARTALQGYLSSTATIGQSLAQLRAQYVDGSGNLIQRQVTQAHRNALAAVIEGELE